jgi:hypothetical protein
LILIQPFAARLLLSAPLGRRAYSWEIRQQAGHAPEPMLTLYMRNGEVFTNIAAGALLHARQI